VTRAVLLGALVVLCSLVFAGSAGAAETNAVGFDVLDAHLSEVMAFQADGGPGCERAGVCGYSGTVSYVFQHTSDGFAAIVARGHRVSGFGFLEVGGLTTATVQGPGGGPPCTDKVLDRFDSFVVEGNSARPRAVFHSPELGSRFLDTYCAGPRDADVARLIPPLPIPAGALRRRSLLVQTSSTQPFRAGPFVGTLSFSAAVRMRRSAQLTSLLGLNLG
jgi:hypothetical protein